jgi:hypothetical protein
MSKSLKIIVVSLVCVATLAAGVKWIIHARSGSAVSSCTNNLRQIDAAKASWAMEHHKTTNDVPTWAEVRPYLPRCLAEAGYEKPVCPDGGTYALGSLTEYSACSIGGPGHYLPRP